MNYTEFIQRVVVAAAPQMYPVTIDSPTEAHIVNAAESLAAELVKRGHLQPPMHRLSLIVMAKPEPLLRPAPGTSCASCLHFQPGDTCSKHDITTTYDQTCPSYE